MAIDDTFTYHRIVSKIRARHVARVGGGEEGMGTEVSNETDWKV